jgi:hypothetical protein
MGPSAVKRAGIARPQPGGGSRTCHVRNGQAVEARPFDGSPSSLGPGGGERGGLRHLQPVTKPKEAAAGIPSGALVQAPQTSSMTASAGAVTLEAAFWSRRRCADRRERGRQRAADHCTVGGRFCRPARELILSDDGDDRCCALVAALSHDQPIAVQLLADESRR